MTWNELKKSVDVYLDEKGLTGEVEVSLIKIIRDSSNIPDGVDCYVETYDPPGYLSVWN